MMPLTKSEGQSISTVLHQMRRDWDLPGINAALRQAAPLGSMSDIALAAVRLAHNLEIRTPALLSQPGAHWHDTAAGTRIAPVMCADHPTQKAGYCLACIAQAVPKPAGFVVPKRDKHQKVWVPEPDLQEEPT